MHPTFHESGYFKIYCRYECMTEFDTETALARQNKNIGIV